MTGTELKSSLGLNKFQFCYIQKILNTSIPTFVVTMDSRRPFAYLSVARVKKSKTTTIQKARRYGKHAYLMLDYKMTPPVLLDNTNPIINSGTIIIKRDIGAEYYLNRSMFEDIENKLKVIEV